MRLPALTVAIVLVTGVLLFMLIELQLSWFNERGLRAKGAVEPPDDVIGLMRVAYPGAFLAMIVEGLTRNGPPAFLFDSGIVVFVLAKALKWWAILTLGRAWTFRVIVVPGD